MVPTPHFSKVVLRTAWETVTGLYLGDTPRRTHGTRRERADKYVVRTGPAVVRHGGRD